MDRIRGYIKVDLMLDSFCVFALLIVYYTLLNPLKKTT